MFRVLSILLIAGLGAPALALADSCDGSEVSQPLPPQPTAVPAVVAELADSGSQAGAPDALLAQPSSESQSVDRVVSSVRSEGCQQLAVAPPPAASADPASGYQKKTEFDNTPYRFNAQKGFTAAEFDAWMQARGIRIATGKPAAVQATATSLPAPADQAQACVPSEDATAC